MEAPLILGSPVVAFSPFHSQGLLLKLNIRKKGTLIIEGVVAKPRFTMYTHYGKLKYVPAEESVWPAGTRKRTIILSRGPNPKPLSPKTLKP